MKIIPANTAESGTVTPAESIPDTAVRVVFDGEAYTVYEEGDELPPPPAQAADHEQPAGQ